MARHDRTRQDLTTELTPSSRCRFAHIHSSLNLFAKPRCKAIDFSRVSRHQRLDHVNLFKVQFVDAGLWVPDFGRAINLWALSPVWRIPRAMLPASI